MRFRRSIVPLVAVVAALAPLSAAQTTRAWTAGEQINLAPWLSPDAALSTAGDYATDTYGDPWDFSNLEDVPPILAVGINAADGANVSNGIMTVATHVAAEIRLVMKWPHFIEPVLPWGRDGWNHPTDAGVYTQTTSRMRADAALPMAVRYWRADGQGGQANFTAKGGDWQTIHIDLANPA